MTINRTHLAGLNYARSIIEENWPAEALLEIVDNCIAQAQAAPEAEPVAAQHRFRNPQKTEPDWTIWQGTTVNKDRPSWEIDSKGYEVEYQFLYAAPQHDAELIELLRDARDSLENNVGMQDGYIDYDGVHSLKIRIDAKLATLKVKP